MAKNGHALSSYLYFDHESEHVFTAVNCLTEAIEKHKQRKIPKNTSEIKMG
jgi:hypothetical protein